MRPGTDDGVARSASRPGQSSYAPAYGMPPSRSRTDSWAAPPLPQPSQSWRSGTHDQGQAPSYAAQGPWQSTMSNTAGTLQGGNPYGYSPGGGESQREAAGTGTYSWRNDQIGAGQGSGNSGRPSTCLSSSWRDRLTLCAGSSANRNHSLQYEYSQAEALAASGLPSDDPIAQEGMCTGVAAEWATDRIRNPGSSVHERMGRLSSAQGTSNSIRNQRVGSEAYLIEGVLSGSRSSAERASYSAMMSPGGVALAGEATEFRLSKRGANTAIASRISEPGTSLVNLYDMRTRGRRSSGNVGHTLSTHSDGARVELFDGNYGEYHADVDSSKSLFKSVVGKYSSSWVPDKVSIQNLNLDESSGS